jgi:hypothetical protein
LFASAVVAKVKNYFLPWEKTPAAEIDFPIQSKFARVNFVDAAEINLISAGDAAKVNYHNLIFNLFAYVYWLLIQICATGHLIPNYGCGGD